MVGLGGGGAKRSTPSPLAQRRYRGCKRSARLAAPSRDTGGAHTSPPARGRGTAALSAAANRRRCETHIQARPALAPRPVCPLPSRSARAASRGRHHAGTRSSRPHRLPRGASHQGRGARLSRHAGGHQRAALEGHLFGHLVRRPGADRSGAGTSTGPRRRRSTSRLYGAATSPGCWSPPASYRSPASGPAGHIKHAIRHPMLIGTILWAAGHLLANGDLASLFLFGAFGAGRSST